MGHYVYWEMSGLDSYHGNSNLYIYLLIYPGITVGLHTSYINDYLHTFPLESPNVDPLSPLLRHCLSRYIHIYVFFFFPEPLQNKLQTLFLRTCTHFSGQALTAKPVSYM